jgi:exopolysaccharide biosynthesis polyprenyl glycosylphosphotransferase
MASETPSPALQRSGSRSGRRSVASFGQLPPKREAILGQEVFHAMLTFERRRAERSRKPFVLMLIDSQALHLNGNARSFREQLTSIVTHSTRETDIVGWYKDGAVLGVIFTETNHAESAITEVLHAKVVTALRENLDHSMASRLVITCHVFPETWDAQKPDRSTDLKLYPDLDHKTSKRQVPKVMKRTMDIAGSGLLLLMLSPILAVIALLIKLTSKGSVIFQQERIGQFGKPFKCLKFRTMYADNDPKIHREYVQKFIAGKAKKQSSEGTEAAVFKITNDPRVTPIGKFLRKTSLDELPQFWNVMCGQMSLVGPRPPLPYEFEVYDFWHRRRVLEVRPGVTGLWQVAGRSRTCFDDMVRLDLRYSQHWSIWLDLRILLATPRAVFMGDGAF